ncbi:transcriptional regulator, TetR family [Sphingomonas guangdongensis]|uniref:Transcriptional regulator, TetR family n=1 Tax=Sphingomonas guangdongensis TaxID=1141890 RepID=A0A285QX05_9SPHN|nr:TetR/AcrR family transcriptional regulator [Sphingomonas guangdongensis]SOB86371.1 transcriptional regulator, TetR family [Sphingomonas guangdongensis]
MARRSDHSRSELQALILEQAHKHMEEVGFARFSAREVAKRIGYSVGTLYNVYGTLDRLLVAVNTRTFAMWADALETALARGGTDRIATLVDGYFRFARAHHRLWHAIYEHHVAPGTAIDEEQAATRGRLTGIVAREVAAAIAAERADDAPAITRSLVAVVHGHCAFELSGSYALMGSDDAQGDALARVRETLARAAETVAKTAR